MTHPGPVNAPTYTEQLDGKRLGGQRERVLGYMLAESRVGNWRSLCEIRVTLGFPEASISARLRDFRKEQFGEYRVDRRRRVEEKGAWEYRVRPPVEVLEFALEGGT